MSSGRSPVMSAEQERWAEALTVERTHGEYAQRHVAERVSALALAGDDLGVRRWREIAECLDRLAEPEVIQ